MHEAIEVKILDAFLGACREFEEIEITEISANTRICDFGIDSIILLELVGLVEQRLGIHLPEEEIISIATVGDLSRLVAVQLG